MNLSKPPHSQGSFEINIFRGKTRLSNGNIEMDFLFLMPMAHAMGSPTDAKKLTSL